MEEAGAARMESGRAGGLRRALTSAILRMILGYAIFQRQIQSGLTAGAVK